jgi:hypothetical protein
MEVDQLAKLYRGKPVWVWIVRMTKGEWCPGAIERISVVEHFPLLEARFDGRSTQGRKGMTKQSIVGISTTRMRYLEFRDPQLKGSDRPSFVPVSISAKPEGREFVAIKGQNPQTSGNGTPKLRAITS